MRQLHPILAALAMALSSISVVTNSLFLYNKEIE
jgi:Cu+-exporting ATPase